MLLAAISAGVVFVGSTPCGDLPRRFIGVPAGAECERITWQLTLTDRSSSAFRLDATYGMTAVNDPGFAEGAATVQLEGTYAVRSGIPSDSDAVVYRLTAGTPARMMEFALLGNNLLHPLSERQAFMVGNASWSYTLSRQTPDRSARSDVAQTSGNGAPVRSASIGGVFEGRTACQELARQLAIAVSRECFKMKWRLTLYPASTTAPPAYKLEGTSYREKPRTGTWAVRTSADRRVVYELDPGRPGPFLSLLRADDNVLLLLDRDGDFLVGDILFSHTFNRMK